MSYKLKSISSYSKLTPVSLINILECITFKHVLQPILTPLSRCRPSKRYPRTLSSSPRSLPLKLSYRNYRR